MSITVIQNNHQNLIRSSPDFSMYKDNPQIAIIPLTQGASTIIDSADLDLVSGYRWYAWWCDDTSTFYAKTKITRGEKQTWLLMHTVLTGHKRTDHIDGNTLNNTRVNLREVNYSQNAANSGVRSNNTSGYKGVYWDKRVNKWRAYVNKDRRHYHVGLYTNPVKAALVRDEKTRELFGEYGRYNFPKEGERSCFV